ncbi:MAG TPA: alpha-amylase family glycosyl hydrolase [Gaiellaceae bacterium]|nr:alpha-amylase family glycosyl hydrolase [Gaiellaceae bacterium]
MSAFVVRTLLDQPHHDGSELYVLERPDELGGQATLRLRTPRGAVDEVALRYLRDGDPCIVPATVDDERDGETWWCVSFPVSNPSTRYRWLLAGGDLGYASLDGLGVFPHELTGADDFVIAPGAEAPDWHSRSVVYEIYPDRYAPSGEPRRPPEWAVPRAWDESPSRGRASATDWFGGDLAGVEQNLDHVERVGANAIYMTPFFPATSTHRYDATTFDRVDPLLGGDEAFASLVRACERRRIRLIGDLTTNHVGYRHDWFVAAQADPDAIERSFFYFDEALPHGYEAWYGAASLPKLDWRSEELRVRMGTVIRKWLGAGLDGWRIDVANMTGRFRAIDLYHDVARFARDAADGSLLVAEHMHDYRNDLDGTGWHGVMNYSGFQRPTWWWLRDPAWDRNIFASETAAPLYAGTDMVEVMRRFRAGVPWDCVLNSWALLDSHDSPRFRTVCGSRERQLAGVGMQFTTPGVPKVFMGDEFGLQGRWGEDARRPMPWRSPPDDLTREYHALASLRRSSDALARGGIRYVHVSDDTVAYLRETRDERLLCCASRGGEPPVFPFPSLEPLYESALFNVWRMV